MRLLTLFRSPSSTPGRRWSYHRAILLGTLVVALALFRPAMPGSAAERTDRILAGVVVGLALAGLTLPGAIGWIQARRRRRDD